jgi:acetylglutamate kinase
VKNILVKLGGSVITDVSYRQSIIKQLVSIKEAGYSVSVVHGGGKLISHYLEKLDVKAEFYEGLRVTTPEALDVVMMALLGKVNKDIVRDFNLLNVLAVGLSGGDARLIECQKLLLKDGYDLGRVAIPSGINTKFYEMLVDAGYVVIIATIGFGKDGYYNINADHTAAFVAGEVKADHLVFVSDVEGVMHPETGEVYRNLNENAVYDLKKQGVITSGMLPKLQSCFSALKKGVSRVSIINGKRECAIEKAVISCEQPGTEITL